MPTFAQLERKGKKVEFKEYMDALENLAEDGKEVPEAAGRIIRRQLLDLTRRQKIKVACLMSEAINNQKNRSSAEAKSYMAVLATLF